MPDIPAALVVLQAHLVAAAAAAAAGEYDVDRGLLTGGKQLRYYWSGETDAPRFDERFDLTGEIVGQRFAIVAALPLSDLSPQQAAVLDVELQVLATQIRTRLDADQDLGGNIDNLVLGFAEPDVVQLTGGRHIVLRWDLDLAFVEYSLSK